MHKFDGTLYELDVFDAELVKEWAGRLRCVTFNEVPFAYNTNLVRMQATYNKVKEPTRSPICICSAALPINPAMQHRCTIFAYVKRLYMPYSQHIAHRFMSFLPKRRDSNPLHDPSVLCLSIILLPLLDRRSRNPETLNTSRHTMVASSL